MSPGLLSSAQGGVLTSSTRSIPNQGRRDRGCACAGKLIRQLREHVVRFANAKPISRRRLRAAGDIRRTAVLRRLAMLLRMRIANLAQGRLVAAQRAIARREDAHPGDDEIELPSRAVTPRALTVRFDRGIVWREI